MCHRPSCLAEWMPIWRYGRRSSRHQQSRWHLILRTWISQPGQTWPSQRQRNGEKTNLKFRLTMGFRKHGGRWLIGRRQWRLGGGHIYAQRSMRFKTRVMPTCVTSSAPDLTFVRRGHHETRTHAASRSGTSGPVLCCFDLSAIHGSMDSKWLLELKNETEPMF